MLTAIAATFTDTASPLPKESPPRSLPTLALPATHYATQPKTSPRPNTIPPGAAPKRWLRAHLRGLFLVPPCSRMFVGQGLAGRPLRRPRVTLFAAPLPELLLLTRDTAHPAGPNANQVVGELCSCGV